MSGKAIVTVVGYVCADADVGEKLVTYRVAVNRGIKNKETGEWTEKATFYRCRDFHVERGNKIAKGTLVSVTGELTFDERPEDKGGGFYGPEIKVWNTDILRFAATPGVEGVNPNRESKRAGRTKENIPF